MFAASQPSGRTTANTNKKSHAPEREAIHTLSVPTRDECDPSRSIAIRLADCEGRRSDASMLINRRYSQRGYGATHAVPTASNCVTFTASSDDRTVGTLSLTVDSSAGMALDRTFKEELDEFRGQPGVKLCELTKFAVDSSESSMKVLASLFHIIFIYGTSKFGVTDLLIEVNPRHVRFYQAMLRFKRIGDVKTNDAVGAPSVLLWLNLADVRRYIDESTSQPTHNSRTLFPHFFSAKEERGIFARLMREMEGNDLTSPFDRAPALPASAPH